jgi:octaprenyl-diphosphate synthase
MSPSDPRLLALFGPVQAELDAMRTELAAQLRADTPAVSDMTDHIARFRGKELRGTLVLLAGRATGNAGPELPTVAAIVELIHLATLVHDDVLDGATVRRRVACVNERWDNQVAVLLGDFLYARAFHLSTQLDSRLCSRLLSSTTQAICAAEIEQAHVRYDFELGQARYEAIAGGKTAALYAAACELGARYPDGDTVQARELRAFGWELGLAFQIIDDVLDVTGREDEVGKSVGNDVEDGKVTLPVLVTYGNASEPVRAAVRDVYTRPELAGGRAARLWDVCDLGPGVTHARARAAELLESAQRRVAQLGVSPAREALETMVDFVLERRS